MAPGLKCGVESRRVSPSEVTYKKSDTYFCVLSLRLARTSPESPSLQTIIMEWNLSHPPVASTAAPNLNIPQPPELSSTDHVTLDVGGRKFCTRKSTLETSAYFKNMLSGRWNVELLPDGSLSVEADEDIFPILL
ncbi:hypothetical protein CC86DRAFT_410111 [Ophiobolus disseminans]|uniref:BTB domain-containing protein n=1 Tax=Ophiobolus disseminans TaxID=1469910 RepID=A0A6A6ZN50_9PLEO|nr:hypothetical protein CC86DRAFT_410111 [Ophiobolus disseminans]